MKEFLDKYMQNSVSRYLAVYIAALPSVEDLRRFEDTMGTDLGNISDEEYKSWATEILDRNNYMIYRIFIEQGILKVKYSTEIDGEDIGEYIFGKDIEVYTFEDLWKKYVLTEDEINVESNPLDFLTTDEIDMILDRAEQVAIEISNKYSKPSVQQQENKSKLLQWMEDNKMTDLEKELQNRNYILQEEVELLQDTIKDMEEEIKTLNIIIKYLENRAGL